MRAYSTVQQLLCHGGYCELILSLARTSCRLLFNARPTARPLAGNPLRDVVRSRNPSKCTLAHDAVATAVLHKHHPIIRVGAGLIQFVYKSHLRLATEASRNRNAFSPFSARVLMSYATISQRRAASMACAISSTSSWRVTVLCPRASPCGSGKVCNALAVRSAASGPGIRSQANSTRSHSWRSFWVLASTRRSASEAS